MFLKLRNLFFLASIVCSLMKMWLLLAQLIVLCGYGIIRVCHSFLYCRTNSLWIQLHFRFSWISVRSPVSLADSKAWKNIYRRTLPNRFVRHQKDKRLLDLYNSYIIDDNTLIMRSDVCSEQNHFPSGCILTARCFAHRHFATNPWGAHWSCPLFVSVRKSTHFRWRPEAHRSLERQGFY